MKIDHPMLTNRLDDERMKADLRKMHITDLASLLGRLLLAEQAIPSYTRGVPLHTDGNGLLEYSAPRALLENNSLRLLVKELYRHRSNPVSVLQSLGVAEVAASVAPELPEVLEARKKVLAGFTCSVMGAVQDAIQNLEAALVLRAKDYDATRLLAKIYSEMGDSFKAERRFGDATQAYRKSIGTVENLIANKGASFSDYFHLQVLYAQAHLNLGIMALDQDRLREAEEEFRRSISGEVRFAETYNNLGVVYERSGRFEEAADYYGQALALNPTLVSARMNIGNIRLRQQDYEEAIEMYRQVEELRPDFAITNYNLGIAYFNKGDLAEAEREFRRALELKPQFPEAQKSLEVVQSKMKSR
jgi:tetratricopeptide (TPR) repeat protein